MKTPSCIFTMKLKNGIQFTVDKREETEEGVLVYWWSGYLYEPAYLHPTEPVNLVKWEDIDYINEEKFIYERISVNT